MSCGFLEWSVILFVILLVFGIPRLPKLGAAIGKTIHDFRRASKNADEIQVRRREPPDDPPKSD